MAQAQMKPAPAAETTCTLLDMEKLKAASLSRTPYDYIVVQQFVRPEAFDRIVADYPDIKKSGSFPLAALQYGPVFQQLLDELQSEEFRKIVEQKFELDLTGRPTMVTIRGKCGKKDGKIHTDTESKIISLLLYMNHSWEENEGGRLRILRSKNIDDVETEISPALGTLLMFRRSDNSYHGHKSFAGNRKVVQLNWVTEQKFADRNIARHSWSSWLKRLNPFAGEY